VVGQAEVLAGARTQVLVALEEVMHTPEGFAWKSSERHGRVRAGRCLVWLRTVNMQREMLLLLLVIVLFVLEALIDTPFDCGIPGFVLHIKLIEL
jgi:hypothetical protein